MAQVFVGMRHTVWCAFVVLAAGLVSCGNAPVPPEKEGRVRVTVTDDGGTEHVFYLEPAIDNQTRVKGLSYRTEIEPDGGMIFVFPTARTQNFVMRHCPIPIDIVYLDADARVVAEHAMLPEEPQKEGEGDVEYERRLKRYSSRYSVPIVLEFDGGTNERLGIEEGDVIEIENLSELRRSAK